MKKFSRFIKLSGVGIFCTGIIAVIQGCSVEREGALFAVLLLILNFCSGPMESGPMGEEPAPLPQIVMFSAGEHNGNLAGTAIAVPPFTVGRAGADNLCIAAKPAGITGTSVRAFISVTTDDEIRDMPANFSVPTTLQIVGPTGIKIAENWDDLFDHGTDMLLASLLDAGASVAPIPQNWWSGSNSSGGLSPNDCQEWTSADVSAGGGRFGRVNMQDASWLNTGSNASCTSVIELMCISF